MIRKGGTKAEFGMTRAERLAGKAQVKEGNRLMDEAYRQMDIEYSDLPPYQVTTGIAVTRALLVAGALAVSYHMITNP